MGKLWCKCYKSSWSNNQRCYLATLTSLSIIGSQRIFFLLLMPMYPLWGIEVTDNCSPKSLVLSYPLLLPPGMAHPFCFGVQLSSQTVSWSTSLSLPLRVPFDAWPVMLLSVFLGVYPIHLHFLHFISSSAVVWLIVLHKLFIIYSLCTEYLQDSL